MLFLQVRCKTCGRRFAVQVKERSGIPDGVLHCPFGDCQAHLVHRMFVREAYIELTFDSTTPQWEGLY